MAKPAFYILVSRDRQKHLNEGLLHQLKKCLWSKKKMSVCVLHNEFIINYAALLLFCIFTYILLIYLILQYLSAMLNGVKIKKKEDVKV